MKVRSLFGQSLDTAEDFLPFLAEEEELLIQEVGVCSPGPLLKKADGHLSARGGRVCCTRQRLESPHLPKCTPKRFCVRGPSRDQQHVRQAPGARPSPPSLSPQQCLDRGLREPCFCL